MDFTQLTILTALVAGVLSFASPCVLPLVPAYLTYITGATLGEISAGTVGRGRVVGMAAAFVLGLSIVFTLLGTTASVLGQLLLEYRPTIARIGGGLIILLGLHMAGILRLPFLYTERRVDFLAFRNRGYGGALLMGAAFGIGWTPCVGAVLGSIWLLASQSETVATGALLLFVYSLGLGLPFVLAALAADRATAVLAALRQRIRGLELANGVILVAMGILVYTERLADITSWFIRVFGPGLVV